MVTPRFRRSEREFFHQDATKEALLHLSLSSSLVIYCGAGVTIDRTGYGWGPLIASVFAPDSGSHRGYPTDTEIGLMQGREDPIRLASALMQYALDQEANSDALKKHLTPLLQNRLYKADVWRNGRLAGNICTLAASAAVILGRSVDIITTNYDTHLEESFGLGVVRWATKALARLSADSDLTAEDLIPSLKVWVRDEGDEPERLVLSNGPSANSSGSGEVNLHYLHGRVPRNGAADGHLVVSEVDYARSRPKSLQTMAGLFGGDKEVLILGASLTDPPLIDALALTKANRRPDDLRRYVVMPRSSLGYLDLPADQHERIVAHLSRRCELLGTRLLAPDFRYQTAQICEELTLYRTLASSPDDIASLVADSAQMRYGLRLLKWWQDWIVSDIAMKPGSAYNVMLNNFQEIQHHIGQSAAPNLGRNAPEEYFRLELWVRENPARYRRLALWAMSSGMLLDPQARRHAELEIGSHNATVQTFAEGRPQHFDISDLYEEDRARSSRWKSYFSVPIYVSVNGGRVSVGAVTLASSSRKEESVLPLPKLEYMEALRGLLIRAGRQLLAPDASDRAVLESS